MQIKKQMMRRGKAVCALVPDRELFYAPCGVALSALFSKPLVRTMSRQVEVDCDVDDDNEKGVTLPIMNIKHATIPKYLPFFTRTIVSLLFSSEALCVFLSTLLLRAKLQVSNILVAPSSFSLKLSQKNVHISHQSNG